MFPAGPMLFAAGEKRTRALSFSSTTDASLAPVVETPRNANDHHVTPASVENIHVPLVLSTPVTAMPSTAPKFESVIRSPPAEAMSPATETPLLTSWSSSMSGNSIVPVLSNTGAAFNGVAITFAENSDVLPNTPGVISAVAVAVMTYPGGMVTAEWVESTRANPPPLVTAFTYPTKICPCP